LFGSKRLHEQYAQKLRDAGLHETAVGRQWFRAAETALVSPQTITLPYKEVGYFAAEKPRAMGLKFSAKRGEKLLFQVEKNPAAGFALYVELWRVNQNNPQPTFLQATDSTQKTFEQEADEDETYILRLQPELLKSGDYILSISVGPTLGFPVPGGKVGSVWGDARDAGARKHEGIDIFAPKRTPTVAAADGTISSVRDGGIGGKAIFMRPSGKAYSLYYAHLDEQLVTAGQRVKAGDTIGLVGNTGNAATTSPHLHFGIYAFGGAVNPLPFVNPVVRKPTDVGISRSRLETPLRSAAAIRTENRAVEANAIVFPLAASAKTIRVELPDGTLAEVAAASLQPAENSLRQAKTKRDSFLLESPSENSPRKLSLKAASAVKVLGYFGAFAFVETESERGWLPTTLL
jgi:murein DD-endopeptidase MepM/ murein hydrolase activator NlpD